MQNCIKLLLKTVATIHAGYSIRGKVKEKTNGSLKIIQMKDINEDYRINWEDISKINPISNREPKYLNINDVLFLGRGTKIYSVFIDKGTTRLVAAPQFFIIKPDISKISAQYLAWYINTPKAQAYFKKNAGGTTIMNVTRKVLENLPLPVLSIAKQQKIISYNNSINRELKLAKQLHEKKSQLLYTLVSKECQEEK